MDLEKELGNMKMPDSEIKSNESVKLTLVQAKKSAALGVWLVAVPLFFLFCVTMKYMFHVNLHFVDVLEETISSLDKSAGTKWLSPLLFMGFPLLSIFLNGLAITHFEVNNKKQLIITLKLKWTNIFILLVSCGIVGTFLLYLITENCK
jgi:hypothetical protein